MYWQEWFTERILNRGFDYYLKNRVRLVSSSDSVCNAYVIGNKGVKYATEIRFRDGEPEEMDCSCPYGQGDYCKHEAALLYYLDEAGVLDVIEKKAKNKKILKPSKARTVNNPVSETYIENPFRKTGDDYSYFDMEAITSHLQITTGTYKKAVELSENCEAYIQTGIDNYGRFSDSQIMVADARVPAGTSKHSYNAPIRFVLRRDSIENGYCCNSGCRMCYKSIDTKLGRTKVCEHCLAALIYIDKYIKENNPGDTTDSNGFDLVYKFSGLKISNGIASGDDNTDGKPHVSGKAISLVPILGKNYQGLKLGFKIGTEKLYKLKGFSELVDVVERQEKLNLGKYSELDFSRDYFDESSRRYFDFIKRITDNRRTYFSLEYGDYCPPYEINSDVILQGTILDELFEIAKDGKVLSGLPTDKGKSVGIGFCDAELAPELTMVPLFYKNQLDGITVKGSFPEVFFGADYHYYFDKGNLCRTGSNIIVNELVSMRSDDGTLFSIGRNKLVDFYRYVLPKLRTTFSINEEGTEVIESLIPPEAAITFYLDVEDNNAVCRVEADYDGETYNCLDFRLNKDVKAGIRDAIKEKEAVAEAEKIFDEIDFGSGQLCLNRDSERIFDFMLYGLPELLKIGDVQSTTRFDSMKVRRKLNLKVGVSAAEGINIMKLEIHSDIPQDELLDVLKTYRQKKRYHRLKSGEYVNLDESVQELYELYSGMNISPKEFIKGKMNIPVYRAIYLDKMLEESNQIYADRNRVFKKLVKDFKTIKDSDFEVSPEYENVMRPYQIYGYKWLRTVDCYGFGGILADEMGLGKTLQAIAVIKDSIAEEKTRTSIVICPASLVYNWLNEFAKFAPDLNVIAVAGSQCEREQLISDYRKYDVLVTSYDFLKRDINLYEETGFLFEIIDEAQYIKTHTTAAAKSVKLIKCKTRLALTGTPIENKLSELWSIFDYLMPGYLYPYETFRKEFEIPISKNKDFESTERLKKMTAPFILRRLKKDVLKDLPDKIEEIRYAKFGNEQQKLYDSQLTHMKTMLESQTDEGFRKNKIQILAELTKIRQICCDPELLYDNYHGESAKRETCLELIRSAVEGDHKVIIFSQFKSMIELLEEDLKNEKLKYYKITGDTPKHIRVEQAENFNTDDTPVFLVSLKAGGTGLNLIGADVVIHYDPWWNNAAQNQATDRAHRIGQKHVVNVYKLIAKDTIEERICKMQENKQNLADEFLSGELGGLVSMSREDLLDIMTEKS